MVLLLLSNGKESLKTGQQQWQGLTGLAMAMATAMAEGWQHSEVFMKTIK